MIQRSRIFYILATICGCILLLPYPGTAFMAFCASCLSLPLYRILKWQTIHKIRQKPSLKNWQKKLLLNSPIIIYISIIFLAIITPIVAFVLLVAPQASRGIHQLRNMNLSENLKVAMPDRLKSFISSHLPSLNDYPQLNNIVDELSANIENFFTTGGDLLNPTVLWQRVVGFLGGTMSVLWLLCLFFFLTIIFTVYAKDAKTIARRIFNIPQDLLTRFILAIRRALSAVFLGIIFVALIQGFFCGLGFAVAGIESPAFWGMLAAFVAPIPMIGTMLVWGPLALLLWFQDSPIAALGLTIWGVVVISNIDSICRPIFLRQGIQAPFVVLILVMVCGMKIFGTIGLIAAPIILAFALALLREGHAIYRDMEKIDEN